MKESNLKQGVNCNPHADLSLLDRLHFRKKLKNPFAFQITPHLMKLVKRSPAVKKQFFVDPREFAEDDSFEDPLQEGQYNPVKGLLHKYPNRVLVMMTSICSAYCRFCDRKRLVSNAKKGLLDEKDIDRMVEYIEEHPEVCEIIFSGGDPLTNTVLFQHCLKRFGRLSQIKVLRVHTRMPVSDPDRMRFDFLKFIPELYQPLYVGIHFNHPDEITDETIAVCDRLRKAGCILYSHTVFLREVNDDVDVLEQLFTRLPQIGVRPYYLLRCEPIRGGKHFIVDPDRERAIASELRRRLSGLACPLYVMDVPQGSGKIPVPLDFWPGETQEFVDFEGKKHRV